MTLKISKTDFIRSNRMVTEEVASLSDVLKQGLRAVVESNRELDPKYVNGRSDETSWRRVEPYRESDYRPLVRSDTQQLLKKLDII